MFVIRETKTKSHLYPHRWSWTLVLLLLISLCGCHLMRMFSGLSALSLSSKISMSSAANSGGSAWNQRRAPCRDGSHNCQSLPLEILAGNQSFRFNDDIADKEASVIFLCCIRETITTHKQSGCAYASWLSLRLLHWEPPHS